MLDWVRSGKIRKMAMHFSPIVLALQHFKQSPARWFSGEYVLKLKVYIHVTKVQIYNISDFLEIRKNSSCLCGTESAQHCHRVCSVTQHCHRICSVTWHCHCEFCSVTQHYHKICSVTWHCHCEFCTVTWHCQCWSLPLGHVSFSIFVQTRVYYPTCCAMVAIHRVAGSHSPCM